MQFSTKTQYNLFFFLFSLALCVFAFYVIRDGETITGNGWDGRKYTSIAQDFYKNAIEHKESEYYCQRIFPSAVVWAINLCVAMDPTSENIATLFQFLNLGIILLGIFLLKLISQKLNFLPKIYLLGMSLLVVNFTVLSSGLYYPTLTDTMSFFLGVCLLYAYLLEKQYIVMLATLLGSFTWPFFMFYGLACLLFPYKNQLSIIKKDARIWDRLFPVVVSLPFAIKATLGLIDYYYFGKSSLPGHIPVNLYDQYYMDQIAILSIIANAIYLSIIVFKLTPNIKNIKSFFVSIVTSLKDTKVLILTISTFAGIKYLKHSMTDYGYPPTNGFDVLFRDSSISGTIKPLVILVEAFNSYGMLIILFLLFFKQLMAYLPRMGGGFWVGFCFLTLISLTPESRRFVNYYPFLVFMVMFLFNERGIKYYVIGIILTLNILLMKPNIHFTTLDFNDYALWFKYPTQLYFMNTYLISNEAYIHTGIAMLVLGAILFFIFKREDKLKLEN